MAWASSMRAASSVIGAARMPHPAADRDSPMRTPARLAALDERAHPLHLVRRPEERPEEVALDADARPRAGPRTRRARRRRRRERPRPAGRPRRPRGRGRRRASPRPARRGSRDPGAPPPRALTRRPVSTSSMARALPTARARRWVPPAPGMIPRLISGWPKVASSAATSMSQAMASSAPPPRAKPRTAAIVGVATAATRSQPRKPGEAARLSAVCAGQLGDVGAGGEGARPGPGDHDRPAGRVGVERLHGLGEAEQEGEAQGVERARPVQRDEGHAGEELRRLDRRPVRAAPAGGVLDEDEVRRLAPGHLVGHVDPSPARRARPRRRRQYPRPAGERPACRACQPSAVGGRRGAAGQVVARAAATAAVER